MKTSIKFKFSIFLAGLLLFTLFILSNLVLKGIKNNQQVQYEQYLEEQVHIANIFFLQSILSESIKVPETFLETKGEEFGKQLELISGQNIVIFNHNGIPVNKKLTKTETAYIQSMLDYALDNKTAYTVKEDILYYFAPLMVEKEQVGAIQFYYSLAENRAFNNYILQLFLYIGGAVFVVSFLLAYVYFRTFAESIVKLLGTVERIGDGHYETSKIIRRDEIGRLSAGINQMSQQIKDTVSSMENEKRKLSLAVNKLSVLDKEQKQFIGNVTHEFKTPLTSIKAYLDLLEMYTDDPDLINTAIVNIKSETIRLYEMVEKVLQLSATEKYEFEYTKERIEIAGLIRSVITPLKGKLDKFGIKLQAELSEAFINADKDSMIIILVNLLDNAIKYNKTQGSIYVKNFIKDSIVIIEITDSGIGIPKDRINKIFEPFYTVDKNRARENGGAGLGLSLAKKLSQVQGGELSVVSTGDEGTTFRVALPIYS